MHAVMITRNPEAEQEMRIWPTPTVLTIAPWADSKCQNTFRCVSDVGWMDRIGRAQMWNVHKWSHLVFWTSHWGDKKSTRGLPSLGPIVENLESDNHMRRPQKQTLKVCFQSRRDYSEEETPTNIHIHTYRQREQAAVKAAQRCTTMFYQVKTPESDSRPTVVTLSVAG